MIPKLTFLLLFFLKIGSFACISFPFCFWRLGQSLMADIKYFEQSFSPPKDADDASVLSCIQKAHQQRVRPLVALFLSSFGSLSSSPSLSIYPNYLLFVVFLVRWIPSSNSRLPTDRISQRRKRAKPSSSNSSFPPR